MPTKTPRKWRAEEILALLRTKHSGQEWALATEVPNATGFDKTRSCDALAMSLWPSKGLHLHGYEIKVSRNDWLTEMQDVSKAAAFARYCHYWWIAAPSNVVKLEELPADWGLVCPTNSDNLRVKKPATLTTPEPPDVQLLAGVFRACARMPSALATQRAYDDGRRDAKKHHDEPTKRILEDAGNASKRELERLRQRVERFERRAGVDISNDFDGLQAQVVKELWRFDPVSLQRRLHALNDDLQKAAAMTAKAADAICLDAECEAKA